MADFFAGLLWLIGLIAFVSGLFTWLVGTTAIHQILGAVDFLIFTVVIGALGIMAQIRRLVPKP